MEINIEELLAFDLLTVLLIPAVVLVTAAVFYLYSVVLRLLSKTTVRNKVVLVTDSLSALGNECAKLFHKGGARLILCGKSWEKLEALSEQLVGESDPTLTFPPKLVQLDFSDTDNVPEAVAEVLDCFGCLDVAVFNSGMKIKAPVQSVTLEMDKIVMEVNYFGPITLAKGIIPSMISRRTGHILLVNSIQGKIAVPFRTTYAASKHAVQAFFDCLRAEVQEYGISVSTVNHTFISAPPEDGATRSIWAKLFRSKPLGVPPAEMASELLNTLGTKKKEIIMARSVSKAALYARALFPNLFFAIMAAGVKNASAVDDHEL